MKVEIKGSQTIICPTSTYWTMQGDKLRHVIPSKTQVPLAFANAHLKPSDEIKVNDELKHVTGVDYTVVGSGSVPRGIVFEYTIEDGKAPPSPEWKEIFNDPRY